MIRCNGKESLHTLDGIVTRFFLIVIMNTLAIAMSNRWEVGKKKWQFETFYHLGYLHVAVAHGYGYLDYEI